MTLSQLSPQAIQARVQSTIGDLLKAREELQTMLRRARTADQLERVQALLVRQAQLEGELPERVAEARALTQGEINLGFIGRVTAFAARMQDHLNQVRAERRAMGLGGLGVEIQWGKVAVLGVAVVGVVILLRGAAR